MKSIRQIQTASLLFASTLLSISSILDRFWIGLAAAVILTGIGLYRPANRSDSIGKVLFFGFLAVGVGSLLWGAEEIWILLACTSALGYWDLDSFYNRLKAGGEDEHTSRLIRDHLLRLGLAGGVSVSISLLALFIRIRLTIGWAILLSLVFVLSLRFGYKSLLGKNQSD